MRKTQKEIVVERVFDLIEGSRGRLTKEQVVKLTFDSLSEKFIEWGFSSKEHALNFIEQIYEELAEKSKKEIEKVRQVCCERI